MSDNIGEGEEGRDPGPAGLVGSGKAVGGVVSKEEHHFVVFFTLFLFSRFFVLNKILRILCSKKR